MLNWADIENEADDDRYSRRDVIHLLWRVLNEERVSSLHGQLVAAYGVAAERVDRMGPAVVSEAVAATADLRQALAALTLPQQRVLYVYYGTPWRLDRMLAACSVSRATFFRQKRSAIDRLVEIMNEGSEGN